MTVSENNSPKVIVSSATGYAVGETIDFTFPYTEKEDVKLKIGDEVKNIIRTMSLSLLTLMYYLKKLL